MAMSNLKFVTKSDIDSIKIITEVAKFVRHEVVGDGGYSNNKCGLASTMIVEILLSKGIWARQVQGHAYMRHRGKKLAITHKWVRVGEMFVDVTLDQFNNAHVAKFPAVVVRARRPRHLICPEDWNNKLYGCEYNAYNDYVIDNTYNVRMQGRENQ
jgi:hypothetical protein